MNLPLITWGCIVAMIVLLILLHAIKTIKLSACHHLKRHHHIFEISSEREILFIPGDPDPHTVNDINYDESDDD